MSIIVLDCTGLESSVVSARTEEVVFSAKMANNVEKSSKNMSTKITVPVRLMEFNCG